MGLLNGLLNNYQEQSPAELKEQYGAYLLPDEKISVGYKLVRDALIISDFRILFIDKQGATGKKTSFKSIYLMNIFDVECETAGFGVDDSEITITYLENFHRTPFQEIEKKQKFEFPKSANIEPLYKFFLKLAYDNRLEINKG